MDNIVFDTSLNPTIEITNVGGDLRITGWDQSQFAAEADEDNSLHVDHDGDRLTIRASDDCTVRLPRAARVSVRTVSGDARAKSLEQKLTLGTIGGDLVLRQIGSAEVAQVGGDLSAKHVAGDLQVGAVGGDLAAREVGGAFRSASVGGDLYLREVAGPIQATAGSDVILSVDFSPEHEYALTAGGDLTCRLRPGASARFDLTAGGEIVIAVPGAQVEGGSNHKTVTLGNGDAAVRLHAGGDLTLTGQSFDADSMGDFGERFGDDFGFMAEEFSAQIGSQIESQMADFQADFQQQFADKMAAISLGASRGEAEELASKARRAAERIERAARQKTEAAQRKAEKDAERAQRLAEAAQQRAEGIHRRFQDERSEHGEQNRRGWPFKFGPPGTPPQPRPPMPMRQGAPSRPATPASDPVSDEERMVILRMVEQGKITVADAEKLLAALEAK